MDMSISKNYVRGDQTMCVPAHLNFGRYMLQHLKLIDDDKIALTNVQTGDQLTYGEFVRFAVRLSTSLSELGIKSGHTVALCCDKRIDFLPILLSVICTGATFTSLSVQSGKAEIRHKFNLTKPDYVICSDQFWDKHHETLCSLDCINTYITLNELPEAGIKIKDLITTNVDIKLFEPLDVQGQTDTAIILYSSGTTGMPKGVMLTHLNVIVSTEPDFCFSDDAIQKFLILGSWFHNYDLFVSCKCLVAGKSIFYTPCEDLERSIEIIDKYKIDMFAGIPTDVAMISINPHLNKYDLTSLKIMYSRSFSLHVKIMTTLRERIPSLVSLLQGYGMTECGEPTSEYRGTKGPKPGSVGVPSPMMTLKVVDSKTREVLGPNQPGEICVKGAPLMKGYLGVDNEDHMDDEGFFKTGDLGYYDEDNYFFIVGRFKEIIKFNGFQVPPVEIETALIQHPDVKDAGVIGVPDPEILENELPLAFVVKRQGSNVTEQDLVDYVSSEVGHKSRLQGGVKFTLEIPRNLRGKILRKKLFEMYTSIY